MTAQNIVILPGTCESRVAQVLQEALRQVLLAQVGAKPRMRDALTELQHILEDQIAGLANAAEDDKADGEIAAVWDDDDEMVA